jgi:hypothetical protein
LVRLVGRVREEAQQRLWDTLAGVPTRSQARQLEGLLEMPRGALVSDLDRLRKGPVTASGKSMVTALDRVAEIMAFGLVAVLDHAAGHASSAGENPRRALNSAASGRPRSCAGTTRIAARPMLYTDSVWCCAGRLSSTHPA